MQIFPLNGPNDLGDGVSTVNTEIGAGHVSGGVAEEEGHGAHQVFWATHLALWDEAGPLVGELGVVVKDLLGAGISLASTTI